MKIETLEAAWQARTQAGNTAIEAGDPAQARDRYAEAMAESERLFTLVDQQWVACLLAPMTYNIAAYNLANAYRQLDRSDDMYATAKAPVSRLLSHASPAHQPTTLAAACMRHLPRAFSHLRLLCPAVADTPWYRLRIQQFDSLADIWRAQLTTAAATSEPYSTAWH